MSAIGSLDLGSSGFLSTITMSPGNEVNVAGRSYADISVAFSETIAPSLTNGLIWIESTYGLGGIASRYFNGNTGTFSAWGGVLGDPSKPYVGIRFPGVGGTHYGWLRFGFDVGSNQPAIIEWAYETEPDVPVTITLPDRGSDAFASAEDLTPTSFTLWADNSLATSEPNEPNPGDLGSGATLWWKWTAPTNGELSIASEGGPFESVFSVFKGESIDSLTEVAASEIKCVNGYPSLVRESQFPVTAGTTYRIKVDSRTLDGGAAPRGEVHLQGAFGTVQLMYPRTDFEYWTGFKVRMDVVVSDWDGPRQGLAFEVDGQIVVSAAPTDMYAQWVAEKGGPHIVRAVWQSTDGIVRKSAPVTIHVRPSNDHYAGSPLIHTLPVSARANNYYASIDEGEPLTIGGVETNSVWWRWTAPADGIATVDVPDANGEISIGVYLNQGTSISNLQVVAVNPADPLLPSRLLNHVQVAVNGGTLYAIAIRSKLPTAGSWLPTGDCDPPTYPGRDFTFRMSFDPAAILSSLAVKKRSGDVMASFAGAVDQLFAVDMSSNLVNWVEVSRSVTTGFTQFLPLPFDPNATSRFFRLRRLP